MRIGIISGYFNPIHTGHLDYIEGARKKCDMLYVIVNNDDQVKMKGSTMFMPEEARLRIVDALACVNKAVLSIDDNPTVVKTISSIFEQFRYDPFVEEFCFMNGGDRGNGNTPEANFCNANNIKLIYNVGGEKTESSSNLIESVKKM
tara:strand:- start:1681 stop:2121 length:441 start_codon:yes stop_codon:yes gene_type:complete